MGIVIIIAANVLAIGAYWIYSTLLEANEKEKRLNSILEKSSKEFSDFKLNEQLFQQFKDYILVLFSKEIKIYKTDLIEKLSKDYSLYKGGNNELFYDLKGAGLIERINETDYFQLGDSFRNLKLTQPALIEFLLDKCSGKQLFTHNMHSKNILREAEITTCIQYPLYFSFGVCIGKILSQKIEISAQHITETSFYLYGKSFIKERGNSAKKIEFQDFTPLVYNAEYKKIFDTWYILSIPI